MKGASIFAGLAILAVAWWSYLGGDRLIPHRSSLPDFPNRIHVVYHRLDGSTYDREYSVEIDAPGISEWFVHRDSEGNSYVCQLTAVLLQ